MSKFYVQRKSLRLQYALDKKANIDHKCCELWYKLNESARIYVKTSVGESTVKIVKDSFGQG